MTIAERKVIEKAIFEVNAEQKLEYYQTKLYITKMPKYSVRIKRKVERSLFKLPYEVQKLFNVLLEDLKIDGPIQKSWHNFSPLGNEKYHCHLNYSYVACWTCEKRSIEIEVYYVGSRENAPY